VKVVDLTELLAARADVEKDNHIAIARYEVHMEGADAAYDMMLLTKDHLYDLDRAIEDSFRQQTKGRQS
jgi:hypothetical protein